MNGDWVGKTVSLNCGEFGFYQGTIKKVELSDQTIVLEKFIYNGMPSKMATITIVGQDIKDLTFLEPLSSSKDSTNTVVAIKKKPKPGVADNLVHNTFKSSSLPAFAPPESNRGSPRKTFQELPRTPNKRSLRQKNEDCFGGQVDRFTEDFDFEKNLALFDKQQVFEEIESASQNQPDVVRLVDYNRKKPSPSTPFSAPIFTPSVITSEPKYRNDQNVIEADPVEYSRIFTGQENQGEEFSTDHGLIVPAISLALRDRLISAAEARGISKERITELMARATTELSVQLLGGERRLNPANQHQIPLVVVLCGPGRSGCYGLATARHLSSQGVRTIAYIPELPIYPSGTKAELSLYSLCCRGKTRCQSTSSVGELPTASVDLVIYALDDHEVWEQEQKQAWYKEAINWVSDCRAPVLSIDPVQKQTGLAVRSKAAILPGLPIWHSHNTVGKIYMVNLAFPTKIYRDVGISFTSPFGSKTYVALH